MTEKAVVPTNMDKLSNTVRMWVHYDNLATSLQKQVMNVRDLRGKAEEDILRLLDEMKMSGATIQVQGAKLCVAERKTTVSLTLGQLKKSLSSWFRNRGTPVLAAECFQHIESDRPVKITRYIKKMEDQVLPHLSGSQQTPHLSGSQQTPHLSGSQQTPHLSGLDRVS